MKEERMRVDFCVVGGGLTGMAAALAAARHGARVALVQDRPVLGGNCSSEVRMHVCGAHGPDRRETGIVEELLLDNFRYNTRPTYTGWDAVMYGKVQYQKGIELILNASVCAAEMEPGDGSRRIRSVRAWQTTTQKWIVVEASLFLDASGDAVLAPLTGADFRMGREGRAEHGESIAPLVPDTRTMGMSCLFQAREYPERQEFVPLPWANLYTKPSDLPARYMDVFRTNFWWIELGGMVNSISDTETCREELLRIAYGVWNYLKNYAPDKERFANLALDWVGFLPGKRESRRYYGDHILTQNDVEAGGRFPDTVAFGGWSMDDHFPEGFYSRRKEGTIYHPAPSPYGIPYRTLYSRNVENLFCAGRCHSATHSALSSTRVMATCSLMGQAAGTAAAIAVRDGLSPRGVYESRLAELQQTLMDDDCWLPGFRRAVSTLCAGAALSTAEGDAEALRDGLDRPGLDPATAWTRADWKGAEDAEATALSHAWQATIGTPAEYRFETEADLSEARLVFDSDLNRTDPSRTQGQRRLLNMRYYAGLADKPFAPPATLVRDFRLEALGDNGEWRTVATVRDNHQRLVRVPLPDVRARGLRFIAESTWGCGRPRVFAFECR